MSSVEMARINIKLSRRLFERAGAQAREAGVSRPEFCRLAILKACDEADAAEARRIRNVKARGDAP